MSGCPPQIQTHRAQVASPLPAPHLGAGASPALAALPEEASQAVILISLPSRTTHQTMLPRRCLCRLCFLWSLVVTH